MDDWKVPNSKPIPWGGLIVAVVLIVALLGMGVWIVYSEFLVKPELVRVIDYGRFPDPVPALRVEEPSGAVVMYLIPDEMVSSAAVSQAVESLDDTVALVVRRGDVWIYYYDTLADGSVWWGLRCDVTTLDRPALERRCQTTQFPRPVPIAEFYALGFRSERRSQ